MRTIDLVVQARERQTKNANRRMRRSGQLPGVLYGGKGETRPLYVDMTQFGRIIDTIQGMTIFNLLRNYAASHSGHIDFVATDAEVVIPGRPGPTRPRPDLAAYKDFPRQAVLKRQVMWDDLCPVLVVEIISPRRAEKDTNRNRQLYWMAGGIAEYWIIDPRKDAFRPIMTALRRESGQPDWHEFEIAPGERYTTELLPGLEFHLEP